MKKINLRALFIISTVLSLLFVVLAPSASANNVLLRTIGFPYYLMGLLADSSYDSYGASMGVGILFGLLGPIIVFVFWIIVLYTLQHIYYSLVRKQIVSVGEKYGMGTTITLVICILAVIALDVFYVFHQI